MISSGGLLKRLIQLEETGLGLSASERDVDAQRKRGRRMESARIFIPDCVNPQRRERCLADPEKFLREYFARDYTRPFTRLHRGLIEAMVEIATNGGEKAVAAPRGRGKSQIVKGVIAYLIFAGLVRFPVPISQTTAHSQELYEDFRRKVNLNEMLYEDFPEVCHPVRCLEGAPQRASRQHIDGELTQIEWKIDRLRLANVPSKYRGPIDYGGVRMEYRGLDAAIRGINRDGDRPDFVPIDEPETRESAKSHTQILDRINALEKDVAGLAGEDHELAQVMLTTLQNSYCLSAQYTDREQRPSWMGDRYGWVEKWPVEFPRGENETGMWHEYMTMRGEDQRNGDRYGQRATQYFLDNQQQMERGGELLSDNYKFKTLASGKQTVYSAWQEVFNFIADKSYEAFCTEYQNDPPATEEIEGLQLTAAKVQARVATTGQREVPVGAGYETIGIDLGKYASHWAHTAWTDQGCIGTVPDYGVVETVGLNAASDNRAIEHALVAALEVWGEEVRDTIKPQLVLVDSGNWRDAAYEFCRRMGSPFFPAKGWEQGRRFTMPKERTAEKLPYHECYAAWQAEHRVWLYHMQGEHWKSWLQSRFLQQSYGEGNERLPGSLALFDPMGDSKRHLSFAQHMVAEEEQFVPKDGKQLQRRWFVRNRNNHWLDAMAMACCAAGVLGVRLMPTETQVPAKTVKKIKTELPARWQRSGQAFLASQR